MLTDITEFLRFFDGIHRRTLRDIQALPPEASGWRPDLGEGEAAWSVNQVVAHICTVREYMASAYRGEGWLSPPEPDTSNWKSWAPLIESTGETVRAALEGTPDEWLGRRLPALANEGSVAGWRILLMLVEHEVHHRSQLDTYAGINGWEPPQIYGRRWEDVMDLQPAEREAMATRPRP